MPTVRPTKPWWPASTDNHSDRGVVLLTEQEISRSWRSLFRGQECTDEMLTKAEQLLDELRPESPLRHRLGAELDELRHRAGQEA
jgi:hypothetical protein